MQIWMILNRFTNNRQLTDNVMSTEHKRQNSEVEHPDIQCRAHNKKHGMAERNIQPAPPALKESVWEHFGCYDFEKRKRTCQGLASTFNRRKPGLSRYVAHFGAKIQRPISKIFNTVIPKLYNQ